jgi:hypothetical protein
MKSNKSITTLILSGNTSIGNAGASYLASMLECRTEIGLDGKKVVLGGGAVRMVGLAGCGIGDDGISDVANAMRGSGIIEMLDIRCNLFG